MPTRNVEITDHLDRFIESQVNSGRFSDANDLMRKALGELELREQEYEAKLAWLRAAVKEGFDQIDRGEATEFASVDELVNHLDDLGKEVLAEFAIQQPGA